MARTPASTVALLAQTRRRLSLTGTLANGLGGAVLVAFLAFLAPGTFTPGEEDEIRRRIVPLFLVYAAVALPLGAYFIQFRPLRPIEAWLRSDRPATADERARACCATRATGPCGRSGSGCWERSSALP